MRIFWQNLIDAAAVFLSASSAQTEFPAANVQSEQRTDPWKSTTAAGSPFTEFLRFDLGSAQAATALLLLDHNAAAGDANHKLMGNSSDAWTSPAFTQAITHNAGVISALFSSQSHRYWRWQLDKQSGAVSRQIGRLFLGPHYTTVDQPDYDGFRRRLAANDVRESTPGGQTYTLARPSPREFVLDFGAIKKADRDQFLLLYAAVQTHTAFFLQVDPAAAAGDELSEILHVRFNKHPDMDVAGFDADLVWSTRWELLEAL